LSRPSTAEGQPTRPFAGLTGPSIAQHLDLTPHSSFGSLTAQ
jgi:hypothetical protein